MEDAFASTDGLSMSRSDVSLRVRIEAFQNQVSTEYHRHFFLINVICSREKIRIRMILQVSLELQEIFVLFTN